MHSLPFTRSALATCFATVTILFSASLAIAAPIDVAVKNWSFAPATVEAHVGVPTVLKFSSTEGVHGVESADLGIAKTTILPDKVTEVTFTPKTAGTFPVHCAILCGEGHAKMMFTVTVLP